jgi:D-alanine-D-alanine ligase
MDTQRSDAQVRLAPAAFGKVAVLLGGRSAEREISLLSGNAVLAALRARGVDAHPFDPAERRLDELIRMGFDRAFVMLHGRYGEDGSLQGALQLLGIPYTGSGVMASALALDKWRTKLLWQAAGLPTPPWVLLRDETDLASAVAILGEPMMVKPVNEGSSIGMTKVARADELRGAYALARSYDSLVLAERFIDGAELTASILGRTALPLIRIEAPGGLYDYHAKYFSDETQYFCPCGLPAGQEESLKSIALEAFDLLGCRGWGRVDLILDRSGQPWLLEVNTAPGMTAHSLVPMAARQCGLSFDELVLRILELTDAA